MTDDPTRIYTDLDGVELYVSDSPREPEYQILHVQDVVEGTRVAAYLPRRVMAALSLALSAGPDAVLRDVRPLLEQVDREDTHPEVSHRYLTTREVRRLLDLPIKCGNVRSELGGARCSLGEHSGDDTWHVDPERKIRWRNYGDGFDVRGWSPDEMEVGPAARAEKLRARQAVVVPTTPTAGAIARDVRQTAQQALEYALLLTMAERHNDDLKDGTK